ncbi:MAG TPA: SDR family NAD(P)-dependent oxidoreductase [Candidatus Omnitrophota bacterium]|nr:SDR family NAD(P)-dependent oxidoreductase [Candidatus Omnitrophota bacterium]
MKILVTGATGFIGRFLVDDLLSRGHAVYALARPTSDCRLLDEKGVPVITADLSDEKSLTALNGHSFDAAYHCAGLVEDKELHRLYKANVAATDNICAYALSHRIPRLIYVSSVAAVSGHDRIPLTEDLPYSATNLYGLSKLEAESLVLEYRRKGLRVAILRPAMVYGEGEPHAFDMIMRLLSRRMLPLVERGRYKMHIAYVRNVSAVLVAALTDDRFLQGTFFIADEEVLTQKEVFSVLSRAVGVKEPLVLPGWVTPVLTRLPWFGRRLRIMLKDRVYDISRLKACGFVFPYTAQEGLRRSAEYWLRSSINPGVGVRVLEQFPHLGQH